MHQAAFSLLNSMVLVAIKNSNKQVNRGNELSQHYFEKTVLTVSYCFFEKSNASLHFHC